VTNATPPPRRAPATPPATTARQPPPRRGGVGAVEGAGPASSQVNGEVGARSHSERSPVGGGKYDISGTFLQGLATIGSAGSRDPTVASDLGIQHAFRHNWELGASGRRR